MLDKSSCRLSHSYKRGEKMIMLINMVTGKLITRHPGYTPSGHNAATFDNKEQAQRWIADDQRFQDGEGANNSKFIQIVQTI